MNSVADVNGLVDDRFAFHFQLLAIVFETGETPLAIAVGRHEQLVVECHAQTGPPDDLGLGQLDRSEVLDQRVLELDRRPLVQ